MSSRANLNDLPEELLDHIFRQLSFETAPNRFGLSPAGSTLRQICLVSKRFKRLAEPHLYRAFSTSKFWSENGTYTLLYQDLRAFLHRMIDRPDLAKCVKTVDVKDEDHSPPPAGTRNDAHPFMRAARSVFQDKRPLSYIATFLKDIQAGTFDAELTLLLALLPNLAELALSLPQPGRHLGALLEAAAHPSVPDQGRPFRALSNTVLHTGNSDFIFDPLVLLKLLAIPSMRQVCAVNVETAESISPDWPTAFSNVEELTLICPLLELNDFKCIVNACKALTSFYCRWVDCSDRPGSAALITPNEVPPVLQSHQDVLQYLHLDLDDDWLLCDSDPLLSIGSLKSLHQLKHLKISDVMLLEEYKIRLSQSTSALDNLFPVSLERLEMCCGMSQDMESGSKFLRDLKSDLTSDRRNFFPNLRSLALPTSLHRHYNRHVAFLRQMQWLDEWGVDIYELRNCGESPFIRP